LGDEGFAQTAGLRNDEAQGHGGSRRHDPVLAFDAVIGLVDQRHPAEGARGEGPAGGGTLAIGQFVGVIARHAQFRLQLDLQRGPVTPGFVLDHFHQGKADPVR